MCPLTSSHLPLGWHCVFWSMFLMKHNLTVSSSRSECEWIPRRSLGRHRWQCTSVSLFRRVVAPSVQTRPSRHWHRSVSGVSFHHNRQRERAHLRPSPGRIRCGAAACGPCGSQTPVAMCALSKDGNTEAHVCVCASGPSACPSPTLLLCRCQRRIGSWVGSSVVHLGDNNVPNALMFIDKYTQVGWQAHGSNGGCRCV